MTTNGSYRAERKQQAAEFEEGSFEASLAALEAVVGQLEEGNLSLRATIETFERGMELAGRCQQLLADAELRIRQIETEIETPDEDPGEQTDDPDGFPF